MDIDKITIGADPPRDINVLIEIPQGGVPVKYELDKDSGVLRVDRFLHTAMYYPGNYGFVPHTLSDDGDPIDVLVANTRPIIPGAVINVRPIGVLRMEDDGGGDEKLHWLSPPCRRRRTRRLRA
jgi:inorganic pyrophosphatase